MKINKKVLLFAIILGLITVALLSFYLKSLEKPSLVTIPYSEIIVAKDSIPAHSRITANMLERKSVHTEAVHPEAIKDMEQAVGGISKSEIIKGEQLLANKVVLDDTKAALSYRIPINMRAITVSVTEVIGVAGFVSPSDRIDILITHSDEKVKPVRTTYTIFQNIEVLATGDETIPRDNDIRNVVSTLTLLVNPAQAEVIAYFMQSSSNFYITLRSPLDNHIVDFSFFNSENFWTYRER